jgi:P-type Cu+ transporter
MWEPRIGDIVAGACGIAAGTPLAILGSIGRAAQDGAIVKGGLYLEQLADVDTILLDKTGTLTFGTPAVTEIRPSGDVSGTALLEAAAIAESPSEHPVAKAILNKASQLGVHIRQPDHFAYTPGRRVVAISGGQRIAVNAHAALSRAPRVDGGSYWGVGPRTTCTNPLGRIHFANAARTSSALIEM